MDHSHGALSRWGWRHKVQPLSSRTRPAARAWTAAQHNQHPRDIGDAFIVQAGVAAALRGNYGMLATVQLHRVEHLAVDRSLTGAFTHRFPVGRLVLYSAKPPGRSLIGPAGECMQHGRRGMRNSSCRAIRSHACDTYLDAFVKPRRPRRHCTVRFVLNNSADSIAGGAVPLFSIRASIMPLTQDMRAPLLAGHNQPLA